MAATGHDPDRASTPDHTAHAGLDTATSSGHKVDATGGERLHYAGMEFAIRASAASTDGAFSIVEEINPVDAPLHVHAHHDEFFYVLDGDHVFTVGDTEYAAGPGDAVFGPRGVPHAQRRLIAGTGRILTMFSPAGFEGFFRDLAEAGELGNDGPEHLVRIAADYGATWIM